MQMLFLLSMKIQFDDFFLDDQCYVFERSGVPISLRPKVFDLLAQLLRHRDRVVRREELVEAVWQRTTVGPGSLSGLVNELRQALGEDRQSSSMIRTVHARGYQFVGKVDERSSRLEQGERAVESLSGGLAVDVVGRECRALIEQVSEVGSQGIILEGSLGQGVAQEASGVTATLFETAHEMGFELHRLFAPDAAFASAARLSADLLKTMQMARGTAATAAALPLPARVWFGARSGEPVAGGRSVLSGGPPGGVVAMAQMVAVLAARKPLVIAVESITAAGSMFAQEIVRFANVLGSAPVLIVALLGQHDEGIGAAAKCRKVLCGDSGFLDGEAFFVSGQGNESLRRLLPDFESATTSAHQGRPPADTAVFGAGEGVSGHADGVVVKPGIRSVRRIGDARAKGLGC